MLARLSFDLGNYMIFEKKLFHGQQEHPLHHFTASFVVFSCTRAISLSWMKWFQTVAKTLWFAGSLSACAQMYNLLNKGSLALPQATLASLLSCQGRKETYMREKCAQMTKKNIGDKPKLWQADAEALIASYLHVWGMHLHIRLYIKAMCSHKMSSVAGRKGNENSKSVLQAYLDKGTWCAQ